MWYMIRTMKGQEEEVRRQAERMLPEGACRVLYCISKKRYLGEWHEEKERLLPGYIFLVADSLEGVPGEAAGKAGSARLSGCGGGICPVGKEGEELLEKLSGGKDEIGMSYGVIENGVLKVRDGALAGLEPAVRKIDRHKRKGYVCLPLPGGEEKLVGIGLEITEKS